MGETMNLKLVVSKVIMRKTSKALGKEVIVNFQKIVPKLKKLKPESLLYFIKNFQKRENLDDSQTAVLIEKLVDRYKFQNISDKHLETLKDISKNSIYKNDLKHLKFYLDHLKSLN